MSFNFSLLDFRDEVFHNYGLKPPLPEYELRQILRHAQKYVNEQGRHNPAFARLKNFLWDDLHNSAEGEIKALFEVILENKPVSSVPHVASKHFSRLVSYLPTKHYWDISGRLYRRVCEEASSFSKIYLNHYRYDEQHRRPEEVLCREIDIPSNAIDFYRLRDRFAALNQKPFKRNDEYFELQPGDRNLYELYGQLYDLLNWGTSNPAPVISYLDARAQVLEFYNCVFPIVFHGVYYGIAYFALPADYFHRTRQVAEKLSRVLTKGWTYVNHYFPAMIFDAYNSRLISRFTRDHVESVVDVIRLINSKLPLHFCYDSKTGAFYTFKIPAGEIARQLEVQQLAPGLDPLSPAFRQQVVRIDPQLHGETIHTIPQSILNHSLVFGFDWSKLPGREKCLPVLESHLGQAVIVLETLEEQARHKREEEQARMLDMLAHDAKVTREVLIEDMREGLESEVAVQQLIEQNNKEKIIREMLLRHSGRAAGEMPERQRKSLLLPQFFSEIFFNNWRAWLKSRRFTASYRRNHHPSLCLNAGSSRLEVMDWWQAHVQAHPGRPEAACLAILRESFSALSPAAEITVQAPPLLMLEDGQLRLEAILNNLLSNFFNHVAVSPLTGRQECVIRLTAAPRNAGVYFVFDFSNSSEIRERFPDEVKALLRYGAENRGLQILRYLIYSNTAEAPDFRIVQQDYLWHIYLGRLCRACCEKQLVFSGR